MVYCVFVCVGGMEQMKFAKAMHKMVAKTFFLSYNNFDMQCKNEKCIYNIYL